MAGVNAAPVDRWSAVHAATGLTAGAVGLSAPWAIGLAVLYEVVEYAHEWPRGSKLFGSKRPESFPNVLADLAIYAGGWWLGQKVRR